MTLRYLQDSVCHLKNSFLEEDVKDYFDNLNQTVPWVAGKKPENILYIYNPKRDVPPPPINVLDELILMTEETFECDVSSVWCYKFKTGDNCFLPDQHCFGSHSIIYSFGEGRKAVLASTNIQETEDLVYFLESGDIFYYDDKC